MPLEPAIHTGLETRVMAWRAIEREAELEEIWAWVVFELFPSEETRAALVGALARLETARAALDVLT